MQLVPIDHAGAIPTGIATTELLKSVVAATVGMYERTDFVPPWIGYLALRDARVLDKTVLGTCGFKSPPIAGRVEIAYFTFPGFEGNGVATAMAAELVQIANKAAPDVIVAAQTLPEANASTAILTKLGFVQTGSTEHPEDGLVWDWKLPAGGK